MLRPTLCRAQQFLFDFLAIESFCDLEVSRGVDVLPQDLLKMVERGRTFRDSSLTATAVEGIPDGQFFESPLFFRAQCETNCLEPPSSSLPNKQVGIGNEIRIWIPHGSRLFCPSHGPWYSAFGIPDSHSMQYDNSQVSPCMGVPDGHPVPMTKHPRQITYEDVEELLELIQLCWMRAPDRFKGYGHNAAEDLQECLLKLVELRTEILDGVVSKESPLNLVLYVRVVVRTLCRKSSLADTPFHENLLALETLAGLMAEMHKEAQKKLSFWVTARPERKFFPSFSCSRCYRP